MGQTHAPSTFVAMSPLENVHVRLATGRLHGIFLEHHIDHVDKYTFVTYMNNGIGDPPKYELMQECTKVRVLYLNEKSLCY